MVNIVFIKHRKAKNTCSIYKAMSFYSISEYKLAKSVMTFLKPAYLQILKDTIPIKAVKFTLP